MIDCQYLVDESDKNAANSCPDSLHQTRQRFKIKSSESSLFVNFVRTEDAMLIDFIRLTFVGCTVWWYMLMSWLVDLVSTLLA
jgi:hypothetical protein